MSGDLRDRASLARAVEGCGVVYHVAADYRLWTREPEEMFRSNVDGTRSLLEAARNAGSGKIHLYQHGGLYRGAGGRIGR